MLVDTVLSHLPVKEVEIELVFVTIVSFMSVVIDSYALFGSKLVSMAVQRSGYLVLQNLTFRNRAAELLYYLSVRWQASPCASFYISHEF